MSFYVAGVMAVGAYEAINQMCQCRAEVQIDCLEIQALSLEIKSYNYAYLMSEPSFNLDLFIQSQANLQNERMHFRSLFGRVQTFQYNERYIYLDKTKRNLELLKSYSITSRLSQLINKKGSGNSTNNQ